MLEPTLGPGFDGYTSAEGEFDRDPTSRIPSATIRVSYRGVRTLAAAYATIAHEIGHLTVRYQRSANRYPDEAGPGQTLRSSRPEQAAEEVGREILELVFSRQRR